MNENFDEKTINALKLFLAQWHTRIPRSNVQLNGEFPPTMWRLFGSALGKQRLLAEFRKFGKDFELRRLFLRMQSSSNLEITGNIVDREKSFKHIKDVVGPNASGLIYMLERESRHFVDYKGKERDSLARTGLIGVVMADIIDHPTVTTEYRIVNASSVVAKDGDSRLFEQNGGAVTIPIDETLVQVFVAYNAVEIANSFNFKDANGNPLKQTSVTIDAHELGHAWGIIKQNLFREAKKVEKEWGEWVFGGKLSAIKEENMRTAVMVENFVRDRLGLPRKVSHNP